ncbi:MAG: hypothetical protein KatS3mg008_2253 [Acidimicrobiales bacterium]|nr:MAG: hypothetical protein KatS3mg008_2253 [Acidimicrobiales bacterium]
MTDSAERLRAAVEELDALAGEVSPEAALEEFDAATLQWFWRTWPDVAQWAGELWRRLEADLATAAAPVTDPEVDEVGGSE